MSILFLVVCGLAGLVWAGSAHARAREYGSVGLGVWSWITAAIVAFMEYFWGMHEPLLQEYKGSPLAKLPMRGIVYMLLSFPILFSPSTIIGGGVLFITGVTNVIGVRRGEKGQRQIRRWDFWRNGRVAKKQTRADDDPLPTVGQRVVAWVRKQIEIGEVSKWVILAVFAAANFIYGVYQINYWTKLVSGSQDAYTLCLVTNPASGNCGLPVSDWGPWAKLCGSLLNLNCALILLPVLKGLLRSLNNMRIGATGTVAAYIPLRKNIEFHKLVALWIGVLTLGHIFFHFMNYAAAPDATIAAFPNPVKKPWYGHMLYAPWYTGAFATLAMFFIYTAASRTVKQAQYEIFWLSHHFFVLFFVCLVFHGPVFVYFCILPMLLYFGERIGRIKRSGRPIYLKTIKWISPVLELCFCPKNKDDLNFVEGQYLYINCPYLSINEWHPFTISSARGDLDQEDFVSVHIRVHPGGWTEKLKNYLELFNPTKQYPYHLWRYNKKGVRKHGKDRGPDGTQLLRIDGPHSAPAQHYGSYKTVMLVGAGIGLTPSAAIIRGILRYKWKKGYFPERVYFYWLVRQSEIDSFQWFVQLLCELEAERMRDITMGNANVGNMLQMHVFVTRAERSFPTPQLKANADIPLEMKQYTGDALTPAVLLERMVHPVVKSRALGETMLHPQTAPNRYQDLFVWDGRPDWDLLFQQVKAEKPASEKNIGVMFCGAPIIGKDLKTMCEKHSQGTSSTMFCLHKENF